MTGYTSNRYNIKSIIILGGVLSILIVVGLIWNQDKSESGWNTFKSEEFGFEFDYPKSWEVGLVSKEPDSKCPYITLTPEWSTNKDVWGNSGRAIAIFREPNLGPDEAYRSDMELDFFTYDEAGDLSDFYADDQKGNLRHGTTRVFFTYYERHNIHYGVIRKRFGSQSLEMYVQIASSTQEHASEATSTLQMIGQSVRLTNSFAGLKSGCVSNRGATSLL